MLPRRRRRLTGSTAGGRTRYPAAVALVLVVTAAGCPQDERAFTEMPLPSETVDRRQQLALHQVTGSSENDEKVRLDVVVRHIKQFLKTDRDHQSTRGPRRGSIRRSASGIDVNRRLVGYHTVELLHLGIRDSDAAVRPVTQTMEAAQKPPSVSDAVNHDVAAGVDPACRSTLPIADVRVRYVERQVESAPRVAVVERIVPFRSPTVALLALRSDGRSTQSDPVGLDDGSTAQEGHHPTLLVDDHPVDPLPILHRSPGQMRICCGRGEKKASSS